MLKKPARVLAMVTAFGCSGTPPGTMCNGSAAGLSGTDPCGNSGGVVSVTGGMSGGGTTSSSGKPSGGGGTAAVGGTQSTGGTSSLGKPSGGGATAIGGGGGSAATSCASAALDCPGSRLTLCSDAGTWIVQRDCEGEARAACSSAQGPCPPEAGIKPGDVGSCVEGRCIQCVESFCSRNHSPRVCDVLGQLGPQQAACSGETPFCELGVCKPAPACATGALGCSLTTFNPIICQNGDWLPYGSCDLATQQCSGGQCVPRTCTLTECEFAGFAYSCSGSSYSASTLTCKGAAVIGTYSSGGHQVARIGGCDAPGQWQDDTGAVCSY